ncbi:MAG TPA: alpha/beta hydrolase-fold protein [Chitinophagaceae bacterium]|jgi:poly(3-hydroxybutyrate) depolymerase
MKHKLKLTTGFVLMLMFSFYSHAQSINSVTIIDATHYSNVFGEIRNYRIFLPPGYFDNARRRYPVIYFLHGWSQRYFGDGGQAYAEFDKDAENNGDNIANFVSAHEVIVVKSDGYNRSPDEAYYLRPYNIGPVETFRQFPLYFPELIGYIDNHYRTIADREHRAISGLSMGGFMTFWIGGKYPDLFSGAGNFCGSAEFMVGPKNFPVEYRHIDMYKNYAGMNVRLNYGDKDFIRGYHQDMNRVWPQVMDNYESKIYNAEHSTCGLGEMFNFFMKTFEHPPAKPLRWDHIDVYPEFSVWDYHVSSDRNLPGFTILENVDKKGFRCSVREFLPNGELMPFVNISVITPPIYEKNTLYLVNDVDTRNFKTFRDTIRSDSSGKIQIPINGSRHEIGINKIDDKPKPNICIALVEIENMPWATTGKDVVLSIKLLNKGLSAGKNVSAKLSATRSSANVKQSESEFGDIPVNEMQVGKNTFVFHVEIDSIEIAKFKLAIRDENKNEWVDFFEIPLKKDVPEIKDFEIADGKIVTVAKGGTDTETTLLGNGNGDGIANPGESIVILVKDKDKYWRTNLSFSDKYVNPFGVNMRMSDNWTPFDHVGASAKYSVPLVSSDCPENHIVEIFAEYWLPEYPLHIIKQGLIKIEVKGKDKTPPTISWVQIHGDNIIQAKVYDGSKIQSVKAKLILKDDSSKSFEVELKDDGIAEDRAGNDNVFSKKIPEQKFGIYRVVLETTDSFNNKILEEASETFVLH